MPEQGTKKPTITNKGMVNHDNQDCLGRTSIRYPPPPAHTHTRRDDLPILGIIGRKRENSEDTTLDWLVALPQSIHTQTLPCKVPSPPGARLSRPALPLLYQSSLARCHAKRDTTVTCNSHISAIAETGQECRFVVNDRKRISASLTETVLRSSGHFGPVSRGPVQWLDS